MSLVGNLEDLSLGDIMQIIGLSQKSGVLALKGADGSGRIVFREGLVHGACVNGAPGDMRGLVVGSGLIDATIFDDLAARAEQHGLPIEQTIAVEGGLGLEAIESALQTSVESVVLEMFSWPSGDFSFDVRSELEPDDPQLCLAAGLNAQYLAMEGMRVLDERSRDGSESGSEATDAEPSAIDSTPAAEDPFDEGPPEIEAVAIEEPASAVDVLVASVVSREDTHPSLESTQPTASTRMMPVVLIDPEVSVLEWVKNTIQDDFARIHVFQQAEQGLARIRQYLIRGELPVVLLSTETLIDPLSGIHGLSDFVGRLKTQAERLVVVGLSQKTETGRSASTGGLDGVLVRPEAAQLRDSEEAQSSPLARALATALQQILTARCGDPAISKAKAPTQKSASIRELRDATEKLQDASSRGEVLPVVLAFAAELFARVAILIVRDEQVFAIAGRGIAALEVDPLDSKPPVSLQSLDAGWVRTVLQSGKPFQGPAATPADQELLIRLGGESPAEAYLGPIESGGSTIAMLYADQAPLGTEMPDTSALEVVLHHAALALDRAALERALWEADSAH
jgi:hypothetical protein